jgi:hypothetical protein
VTKCWFLRSMNFQKRRRKCCRELEVWPISRVPLSRRSTPRGNPKSRQLEVAVNPAAQKIKPPKPPAPASAAIALTR